jgi:hypothetical protein
MDLQVACSHTFTGLLQGWSNFSRNQFDGDSLSLDSRYGNSQYNTKVAIPCEMTNTRLLIFEGKHPFAYIWIQTAF